MRAARLAVLAVFFLNGFALAGWFVWIPAVQEKLEIGEGPLGVALLGAAAGALLSMPLAGALVSRLGNQRMVGVTTLLLAGAMLPLALAPSLPVLVSPGPAVAAVSTARYSGFLVGPATIGFLAEAVGLGTALYVVGLLSATIAALSRTVGTAARGKGEE